MWTFDNFPTAKVQQPYGFTPSAAFLDHVRKSSLRIAGGCSASFISPQGLVMTETPDAIAHRLVAGTKLADILPFVKRFTKVVRQRSTRRTIR